MSRWTWQYVLKLGLEDVVRQYLSQTLSHYLVLEEQMAMAKITWKQTYFLYMYQYFSWIINSMDTAEDHKLSC